MFILLLFISHISCVFGRPIAARKLLWEENVVVQPIELERQTLYFEGDIISPNEKEIGDFIARANAQSSFSLDEEDWTDRNAIRDEKYLWTEKEVPLLVSAEFSEVERREIGMALEELHRKTCVRFVPKTAKHTDFAFMRPGKGCGSSIGRQKGRQDIILESGCMFKGIILHEVLHTVGFFHEQSRADRDMFVKINLENVENNLAFNFRKYDLETLSHLQVSYDYFSIMHYGTQAFSRNGLPTIVPLQNGVSIGQRKELSEVDAYKINKLYKCPQYLLYSQNPYET